jgi:hypothetical protein
MDIKKERIYAVYSCYNLLRHVCILSSIFLEMAISFARSQWGRRGTRSSNTSRSGELNQRQKFVINELLPRVLGSVLHSVTAAFVIIQIDEV